MSHKLSRIIVIAVLAAFGIGGLVGGTVAISMVNSNLKAQEITFGEDTDYAGQQVSNGLDAYRFQEVIGEHVKAAIEPVGASTYSEMSSMARASVTDDNPTGDPKLQALRRTALDGELLRGTLFSSFAWWLVGWVGIAAGIAFSLLAVAAYFVTRKSERLYFPAAERLDEKVAV